MTEFSPFAFEGLPGPVEEMLKIFVHDARESFGSDLCNITLFGSGAEGQLRPASDINLLILLKQFERRRVDTFREPLRAAQAAARASVMFLLESELTEAAEAFAVKFDDIIRRHRVLHGEDYFAPLSISRATRIQKLRQILLNLVLRLRERYATLSLEEERLGMVLAEAASPLRAAAATICELEGQPAPTPKAALERIAARLNGGSSETLALISEARQARPLPPGRASAAVCQLIHLGEAMRQHTERLS